MLSMMSTSIKSNNLNEFKKYLDKNQDIKKYTTLVDYGYDLNLQIYKDGLQVNPNNVLKSLGLNSMGSMYTTNSVFSKLFNNASLNESMYEVLAGTMPKKYNEVVLVVDKNNRISDYTLYALGIKDQNELKEMYQKIVNKEEIDTEVIEFDYEDFLNLTFKVLLNSDYYTKESNHWVNKKDDEDYINKKLENALEIKIVGIIKPSSDTANQLSQTGGVLYIDELEKYVINKINESEVVKEQIKNEKTNVLTGLEFNPDEFDIKKLPLEQQKYLSTLSGMELARVIAEYQKNYSMTYEKVLKELGHVNLEEPSSIYIYAKDFESKDNIKTLINNYNKEQENNGLDENVIRYSDIVGILMSSVTSIIDMISYVLIGFVSISLVVSSIMIGIITYISVLERTKEIGILRAIGASKKDISHVFNAETLIIGLSSGIIGILVTLLLNIPINALIKSLADVSNITKLPVAGAIVLIIISVILTLIGGLIPSRMASKKDPVEALRSE